MDQGCGLSARSEGASAPVEIAMREELQRRVRRPDGSPGQDRGWPPQLQRTLDRSPAPAGGVPGDSQRVALPAPLRQAGGPLAATALAAHGPAPHRLGRLTPRPRGGEGQLSWKPCWSSPLRLLTSPRRASRLDLPASTLLMSCTSSCRLLAAQPRRSRRARPSSDEGSALTSRRWSTSGPASICWMSNLASSASLTLHASLPTLLLLRRPGPPWLSLLESGDCSRDRNRTWPCYPCSTVLVSPASLSTQSSNNSGTQHRG